MIAVQCFAYHGGELTQTRTNGCVGGRRVMRGMRDMCYMWDMCGACGVCDALMSDLPTIGTHLLDSHSLHGNKS